MYKQEAAHLSKSIQNLEVTLRLDLLLGDSWLQAEPKSFNVQIRNIRNISGEKYRNSLDLFNSLTRLDQEDAKTNLIEI